MRDRVEHDNGLTVKPHRLRSRAMEETLTIPVVRARLARATQLGRLDEARAWRRRLSWLLVRQYVIANLEHLDGEARADLRSLLDTGGNRS